MKKLAPLCLIFIFLACSTRNGYKIKGTIKGYPEEFVYLNKVEAGNFVTVDSVFVINENFIFQGVVEAPEMYYLTSKSTSDELSIFLDNSEILIETTLENFEDGIVKGSIIHDEFTRYIEKEKVFEKQLDSIYSEYKDALDTGNEELMKKFDEFYKQISDEKIKFMREYILNNTKSFISPYLLYSKLVYYVDLKTLDSITNNFDLSLEKSPYVELLKNRVEILKRVDIGQSFVELELNDTSGTPIALSSFKGKYVLIDFWASWCPPCRAENPEVVELYKKYRDKGLEVYAVSLDRDRKKWIKGIKEDSITYTQVSDLKGWQSSAAKLYGVVSIPHTVLLDEKGIIVAKNISGEELQEEISELLD